MKRLCTLLTALCLAMLLALPASGASPKDVRVTLNGAALDLSRDAYITDGATMVPLRALAEALGYTVTWDSRTRTAALTGPEADTSSLGKTPSLGNTPPLEETLPPVETPPVVETLPLTGTTVALDPGHGGAASGACYGGASEKELNLAIAEKTALALEAAGARVVLTREDDRDVGLYERTALAERQGADVFVSIHCNASTTHAEAAGVYTASYSAGTAGWNLAECLRQSVIAASGAADMGIEERPDLAVLRTAVMPAALVECGFMTNSEELERLSDPAYQDLLARGIADGVAAWLAQGF